MNILKFGGTSLGSGSLVKRAAGIVAERAGKDAVVVVSAMGHTTDRLVEAIEGAIAGRHDECRAAIDDIRKEHRKAISQAVAPKHRKQVKDFLNERLLALHEYVDGVATLRECSARSHDFIVGHGELFSAQLFAAALRSLGFKSQAYDATEFIVTDSEFGDASIDIEKSDKRIRAVLKKRPRGEIAVVTGFLGATDEGVPTTIGRGGSDLSATTIGAAMGAKTVEIWTDVSGVLSADPRVVADAFPLKSLSYAEAMEMAYFGAKVIYPKAISPLMGKGIPLHIRNTLEPEEPGTFISKRTDETVVKGISSIDDVSLITLEGSGMIGVRGIAGRMFSALARRNINVIMISQASSEQSVCCAVRKDVADRAIAELKREFELELHHGQVSRIRQFRDMVIVAVVGEGMRGTPGVAGKLFRALGRNRVNVVAIAQGSSEINISFVVDAKDKSRALNLIHGAFHLSKNRINVFMVGKGTIGSKFVEQIRRHRDQVRETMGIDLRVVGFADSKRFVFSKDTIDLKRWRSLLGKGQKNKGPREIAELLMSSGLENIVVVDATASDEIARWYPRLLASGICVVTPNKRAGTLPMKLYKEIMAARGPVKMRYSYEATVGAGLPIISTLHDLIDTGDEVHEIEGVFSGTLSYIFSMLSKGATFSDAVQKAHKMGFTEPDPRDDLCGEDVARKLLILARELGMKMELKDICVANLVPKRLRKVPLAKFMKSLKSLDAQFADLADRAEAKGCALQYCGRLKGRKATVGVAEIPLDSPLARMEPGDNMIIFKTERYMKNPLVVQGPGAGPDVTAGGVFADLLRLSQFLIK